MFVFHVSFDKFDDFCNMNSSDSPYKIESIT